MKDVLADGIQNVFQAVCIFYLLRVGHGRQFISHNLQIQQNLSVVRREFCFLGAFYRLRQNCDECIEDLRCAAEKVEIDQHRDVEEERGGCDEEIWYALQLTVRDRAQGQLEVWVLWR